MTAIAQRFDALEARGRALRRLAKASTVAGLCIVPAASLLWCADPTDNGAFGLYVAVPPVLVAPLTRAGAGLVRVGPALLSTAVPPMFGYIVPLLFALGWLGRRLIPSRGARIALVLASPLWLGSVLGALPGARAEHLDAARTGVIADRDGLPPVAIDGTGQNKAKPFLLRPERFDRERADAARFVLAQQAYIDARPRTVGAALSAMTGAWAPATRIERQRLAIVAAYADAAGQPTGMADALSGGWHPAWWRAATLLVALGGASLAAAGLLLDLVGKRRTARGATLRERLAAAPPSMPPPPSPPGATTFGRASHRLRPSHG